MPVHIRARVSWQYEDLNPKNQAVINPCFRHQSFTPPEFATAPDAQTLADDLAAAMATFTVPATKSLTVKLYDIEGTKPVYPMATKTVGTAPTPIRGLPQQAICLSFYTSANVPRKRGRLYIPAWTTSTSDTLLAGARVDSTLRTKVGTLAPIFSGLGGTNVDWIVWSTVNNSAGKVQNYWIDESWDIVRSRKLASTARTTATTGG